MSTEQMLRVYITSVSYTAEIQKQQRHILRISQEKKIEFQTVDISQVPESEGQMMQMSNSEKAFPPQLSRGDTYLGNYDAFQKAVDDETLLEFLGLC